ncbi:hypothetical protein JCM9492_00910 [Aquifex pyrophilus]
MEKVCNPYDNLTGLFSNIYFREKVREFLQEGKELAIALIKVENIWQVNTLYGFKEGDNVIKEIARRLQEKCGNNSVVGRIYGTIFGCCFSQKHVRTFLEKLLKELAKPIPVKSDIFTPDVKIGVSLFPAHGKDVEELMRKAELALYMVLCGESDGNIYVYSEKCEKFIKRNIEIRTKLEEALKKGEITLYYQPIVRLYDEKIIGFEALLRWIKNGKVYISTDLFIEVAEKYDKLIKNLSYFVLRHAIRDIAQLDRNFSLFINFSARQFKDENLPSEIRKFLCKYNFPAHKLVLEITERTMMENPKKAKIIIDELKALGVKIAIDDFGTGFSSMEYLVEFNVDRIKIDKKFIDGILDDKKSWTIVKSVINLSHNVGALSLAEGVETKEQVRELKKLGCDEAQGYYFSKPLPYEKLIELLKVKGYLK